MHLDTFSAPKQQKEREKIQTFIRFAIFTTQLNDGQSMDSLEVHMADCNVRSLEIK
jgi:hypothetical protein